MKVYSDSIKMYLKKYNEFQTKLSNEIKLLGGDGLIHGCIIDIDFMNHIFVNPLDNKITAYFANDMIEKYVYKNVQSLLKFECPTLYDNYLKIKFDNTIDKQTLILKDNELISDKRSYEVKTDIYKISRIIKGLQLLTNKNVIRIWNDELLKEANERNGKLIIKSMIEN